MDGETVTVHAIVEEDASAPALAPFLALLEADIVYQLTEKAVQALTPALAAYLDALAREIGAVSLDDPIVRRRGALARAGMTRQAALCPSFVFGPAGAVSCRHGTGQEI